MLSRAKHVRSLRPSTHDAAGAGALELASSAVVPELEPDALGTLGGPEAVLVVVGVVCPLHATVKSVDVARVPRMRWRRVETSMVGT